MQNSDVVGQLSVEFFVMHVCVFVISMGVGERGRGISVEELDMCYNRWKYRRTVALRLIYAAIFTVSYPMAW